MEFQENIISQCELMFLNRHTLFPQLRYEVQLATITFPMNYYILQKKDLPTSSILDSDLAFLQMWPSMNFYNPQYNPFQAGNGIICISKFGRCENNQPWKV
jgi:hypothetical protein